MNTLIDLLKTSVLTQGLITLAVLGLVVYLTLTGQPISDQIWNLTVLVIGFYFGSKVGIVQGSAKAQGIETGNKVL